MEEFAGILKYEFKNENSKSEGYFPYLESIPDAIIYKLYRKNIMSMNDSYFEKYNQKEVIITGLLKMDEWIEVYDIKEIDNNIEF